VEKNQQLFKEEEKKREGEKISKQKTKTKNIIYTRSSRSKKTKNKKIKKTDKNGLLSLFTS
tara:strand:+ start:1138 stop:1320 length:183 start_codon:yes stop_codon:yes gene_type:complete